LAAIVGQLVWAVAEATSALAMGRRLNSPSIVATALYAHALACSQSQPSTALAALDEYVSIGRGGISIQVLARCLALSAQIRTGSGDRTQAFFDLREAIETAQGTGDRPAMAFALARAVFVLHRDDPTTAAVVSGVIGGGVLGRQFPVLTWERDWFQRVIEEVKAVLGYKAYQVAVDHGMALAYDDAVATALDAVEALTGVDPASA
jgi:hypothetical protein